MMKVINFYNEIKKILPELKLSLDEPMSKHTSFRIGGPAQIMAFPENDYQLSQLLKMSALMDIKTAILGAGTNVLAPDRGVCGLVICLKDCFDGMKQLDETRICVAAGVTMTRVAIFAASAGLSGLEFAHGIPGTVGGGVYMNAGAYGGEICQVCESVDVMDMQGNVRTLSNGEMGFSYRHSILEDEKGIVLRTVFSLQKAQPDAIRARMQELMQKRKASQPLEYPSAGSAFKRPTGGYAAALIEGAGLKGYQVGGAAISSKHAGFAVNLGGATAEDVTNLLTQVSDKVFEQTGIRLEPEVRIW